MKPDGDGSLRWRGKPAKVRPLNQTQILDALSFVGRDVPHDALWAAYDERETLTPALLDALRAFIGGEGRGETSAEGTELPWMAMYLLAQFREARAFELYEAVCRFPTDLLEEDIGDLFQKDFPSFLASTCAGDPARLQRLALDPTVNEYGRGVVVDALITLVVEGAWSAPAMIAWLREVWPHWQDERGMPVYDALLFAIANLGARDLMPLAWKAFEDGRMELGAEDLRELEAQCGWGEERRRVFLKHAFAYVEDAGAQMAWSPRFRADPDEAASDEAPDTYVRLGAKVGRNDPCPCGSGKKYKKCCLSAEPAG